MNGDQSGYFCQSEHLSTIDNSLILQRLIDQLNNSKINHLHNLQTITIPLNGRRQNVRS